MAKTFLVTGAMGCIGAWSLHHLVKEGIEVVSFDLSENRSRLNLLLSPEEQNAITFVKGDLTDTKQVERVINHYGVTHILHLAALQVPFCKADPVMGARVNVVGTVNIFEAALQAEIKHIALASSVAVYGPPEMYETALIAADATFRPDTLYGVYKQANEGTARIYWQDKGISSVTLRPYTVYGVGRDQGLTSEPTKAMLAAARGESYDISFGGKMQFHLASDVARQFIEAAEHPLEGANGFNLGTDPVAVADLSALIEEMRPGCHVSCTEVSLPFPEGAASGAYADYSEVEVTGLEDGIRQTIERFERCLSKGLIAG